MCERERMCTRVGEGVYVCVYVVCVLCVCVCVCVRERMCLPVLVFQESLHNLIQSDRPFLLPLAHSRVSLSRLSL